MARAYRRERARETIHNLWWVLKNGSKPKAIYVENGSYASSKGFRRFCEEHGIKVIGGRPYYTRERGKLERFHGILTQELETRVRFRTLPHYRR